MQHPRALLLLLAASLQAASAFKFTGPSTDEPLDLSAPITLTWERGDRTAVDSFNLFFHGGNGTDYEAGEKLLFAIGPVDVDDGSFEWDPVPRVSRNQETQDHRPDVEPFHHFSSGRDYYFTASFEADETHDVNTGNYTVVNWEVSAAGRTTVTPLLALVGLVPVAFHFL